MSCTVHIFNVFVYTPNQVVDLHRLHILTTLCTVLYHDHHGTSPFPCCVCHIFLCGPLDRFVLAGNLLLRLKQLAKWSMLLCDLSQNIATTEHTKLSFGSGLWVEMFGPPRKREAPSKSYGKV